LKAHPPQTQKHFWIDGEGRDEIYGGSPADLIVLVQPSLRLGERKVQCSPAKVDARFTEVDEVVGVGMVGGGVGAERVSVRRLGAGEGRHVEGEELNLGVNASATRLGCQWPMLRAKASMPFEKAMVVSVVSQSMNEEVDTCQPHARRVFIGATHLDSSPARTVYDE
jgi:hypothetical protein